MVAVIAIFLIRRAFLLYAVDERETQRMSKRAFQWSDHLMKLTCSNCRFHIDCRGCRIDQSLSALALKRIYHCNTCLIDICHRCDNVIHLDSLVDNGEVVVGEECDDRL